MINTKVLTELASIWRANSEESARISNTTINTTEYVAAVKSKLAYRSCADALEAAIRIAGVWTAEKPTVEGHYLVSVTGNLYLAQVWRGRWQDRQNPEWLYVSVYPGADPEPLNKTSYHWLGPITGPEQPKDENIPF